MPKKLTSQKKETNFSPAAQRPKPKSTSPIIQKALTIGKANDHYEQEADHVANQVMNMPSSETVQRSCSSCLDEPTMQQKPLANTITPLLQTQPMEEEEEMLQAKSLLQKQEEEEEMAQPKMLKKQPMEEEEEMLQAKSLLQKQEEEEEMAQPKMLQKQPMEEEEEMLQPKLQLQKLDVGEEELQAKPLVQMAEEDEIAQPKGLQRREDQSATSSIENSITSSKGSGNNLPSTTQSFMENRFGSDFSNVKVHTNDTAVQMNQQLNSQAFTVGNNIYFNSGKYQPESNSGKQLLAHELTHTIQQNGSIGRKIQRANLTSPRLAGNDLFEKVLDNKAVIEYGDTGTEVRRIQQLLVDLGFYLKKWGTDGVFKSETKEAVKKFQKANGLSDDGRVGYKTIDALDKKFPAFTLPAKKSDPWTWSCILKILCPWNRNLVENIMPSKIVKTFTSRTFKVEKYDGTTWSSHTFNSGGFQGGNRIGLKDTVSCETFAFVVYHEGWHAIQGSEMDTVMEAENDAYTSGEQWSIDIGLPGHGAGLRKTGAKGKQEVDTAKVDSFVKSSYGGVSSVPGERVLSRVGASDVRVLKPDGTIYIRPAQNGDSVKHKPKMTGLKTLDPAKWTCP